MIENITVQGYKSIKNLDNFKLNNLNVLIGANGSGKSNFLSVFKFLREIYYQNLEKYVAEGGFADNFLHFGKENTDNIFIKLNFEHRRDGQNKYDILFTANNENKLLIQSENAYYKSPVGKITRKLITSYAQESNINSYINARNAYSFQPTMSAYVSYRLKNLVLYHFHDTSKDSPIKKVTGIIDNKNLKHDAENIAAFLYRLKKDFSSNYIDIIDTIQLVAPFFYDFVTDRNEDYVQLEWYHINQKDTPLKAHLLSDGTLRFICLTILLMQPKELLPDTIIIDEPELGLHPYAISVLVDMLKKVSSIKQVIVSTQSVELINYLSPEDIIVVNQNTGISTFERLEIEDLKEWLEIYNNKLGEIWKSNIIGGRP